MDQIKIGKFIAESRKKNNLTQMQLAEKLNITDRAISKWENGKAMPDSSIMLDLCNELKISVNELLSGERIDKEDYVMKAENNFLQMFNNNKGKQRLAIMQLVGGGLLVCGLVLVLSFPHLLELSGVQDVIMRLMGIFVLACGFAINYLAKKIKYELTV